MSWPRPTARRHRRRRKTARELAPAPPPPPPPPRPSLRAALLRALPGGQGALPLGSRDRRGARTSARLAASDPGRAAPSLRRAPAPPPVPLVRRGDFPQRRRDDHGLAPRARLAGRA